MAKITVYGLAACDTCRQARRWLANAGAEVQWHDVRADGLPPDLTERLAGSAGWEQLVNRRSQTWRSLDAARRDQVQTDPAELLANYPTLMKRPVLETPDRVVVGFSEEAWAEALEAGR